MSAFVLEDRVALSKKCNTRLVLVFKSHHNPHLANHIELPQFQVLKMDVIKSKILLNELSRNKPLAVSCLGLPSTTTTTEDNTGTISTTEASKNSPTKTQPSGRPFMRLKLLPIKVNQHNSPHLHRLHLHPVLTHTMNNSSDMPTITEKTPLDSTTEPGHHPTGLPIHMA